MTRPLCILLCSLFLTSTSAVAEKIQGVDIPDTLSLTANDSRLVLNGAGVREKFFLDIYIGALYLKEPASETGSILGDTGPASVLMHILYSEVSRKKITDGWNDGLKANLAEQDMQKIRTRLAEFNNLFRTVHQGDVIRIDYTPAAGTEVRINDDLRGSVEGNDFFRALLQVWLGPRPVSKSLKREMLGGN